MTIEFEPDNLGGTALHWIYLHRRNIPLPLTQQIIEIRGKYLLLRQDNKDDNTGKEGVVTTTPASSNYNEKDQMASIQIGHIIANGN